MTDLERIQFAQRMKRGKDRARLVRYLATPAGQRDVESRILADQAINTRVLERAMFESECEEEQIRFAQELADADRALADRQARLGTHVDRAVARAVFGS
jgi:hypothetical protein